MSLKATKFALFGRFSLNRRRLVALKVCSFCLLGKLVESLAHIHICRPTFADQLCLVCIVSVVRIGRLLGFLLDTIHIALASAFITRTFGFNLLAWQCRSRNREEIVLLFRFLFFFG